MVVYHGTIRKKSEKQTNLSVDTLISAWAIQEHLTALPLGIGSSFSQSIPRFTTRLLSESSGGGKISFGSISGTSVKHQLFLVLLFDGRNPANQLRLAVHPIIYEVFYIPGGAGILPSTVWLKQPSRKTLEKTAPYQAPELYLSNDSHNLKQKTPIVGLSGPMFRQGLLACVAQKTSTTAWERFEFSASSLIPQWSYLHDVGLVVEAGAFS